MTINKIDYPLFDSEMDKTKQRNMLMSAARHFIEADCLDDAVECLRGSRERQLQAELLRNMLQVGIV